MSDATLPSEVTPERAQRYIAQVMPQLLTRAAANLGVADTDGNRLPDPNAHAARVALLSAEEVLEWMGPLAGDDYVVPMRAALDRLEQLFAQQYPDLPLKFPGRDPA